MAPSTITSPSQTSIDTIYGLIEADLNNVKQSLLALDVPESELLKETLGYTMENAGKLLRPALLLLMAGATAPSNSPSPNTQSPIHHDHVETAAVAELIHVATLLRDDVLDDSNTRRGRATLRAQWGNKVSILSGDYLLAQASVKLAKLNNCRLVSIYAHVLSYLSDGELEQVRTSYSLENTWDTYFQKTFCKTASLFSACCESAGVINQLPEEDIETLKAFGQKFGIVFQIIDDLLDYTGSEKHMGKPVLDDLKNGLINAPILIALDTCKDDPATYQKLQSLIEGVFNGSNADIEGIFEMLEHTQAIEKTQAMAQQYVQEACELLTFLPESPYRQALMDLTHYAIARNK